MNKKIIIGLSVLVIFLVTVTLILNFSNFFRKSVKMPSLTNEEKKIVDDKRAGIVDKLKSAKLSDKEKFDLTMQLGFQDQALKNYKDAEDAYIQASKIQPDNYVSYVALYQIQLDTNNNDGAIISIQKAISLKPEKADLWNKYIMAEKERFNADNKKLEELYKEALVKTYNSIDITTTYAKFLGESGSYKEAIEYWNKAITYNPQDKELYEKEISNLESKLRK